MNEKLQSLMDMLALLPGRENLNMRAILAQSYIQSYGPIPDEYGDQVKKLLAGEVQDDEIS